MKSLAKLAIIMALMLAFTACGSDHDSSTNSYAMPEDGYYIQTALYINGVEQPVGSYNPEYIWVDGQNKQIHNKGYDHGTGSYHHDQKHFNTHHNEHSNHHGGRNGHRCYNISNNGYETETIDGNDTIRAVFTRCTQEVYENIATVN